MRNILNYRAIPEADQPRVGYHTGAQVDGQTRTRRSALNGWSVERTRNLCRVGGDYDFSTWPG